MNTRTCGPEGCEVGGATEGGSFLPSRKMGIETGRIEMRVENVAGYLITPGFVMIELHLIHVSVETSAEVSGRQIPSRDTSVFRLGVEAQSVNDRTSPRVVASIVIAAVVFAAFAAGFCVGVRSETWQ